MLRTPQIIGYTAKTHPDIYSRASVGSHSTTHTMTSKRLSSSTFGIAPQRTMSVDESLASKPISETPFDEIPEEVSDDDDSQHSGSDDSTLVQSVATLRQDRNSTTNVIESYQEQDALDAVLDAVLNQSDSRDHQDLPEDEIADDFAELLLNNILNASESSASTTSNIHQTKQGGQNILYAYDDEENSTFTNIQAAPTFSDESTTMSAMLAQQTPANLRHGAQTVKPHVQKLHGQAVPTTQALNLSPLQMTPARSLKWRELAEQAQKQDNQKKNSIFRGKSAKNKKKSGLSERNTNII